MKNLAIFSFFGRLRLLQSAAQVASVEYPFRGSPAVKDSIEALGVPHTEVDLILACGRSVAFDHRLRDADRIEVHPYGSPVQVEAPQHLSPPMPQPIAFVLDVHLGKLARRLRMLGFDCRYRNDYSDPQIIEMALGEGLIILTRDRGILKHSCVTQGYLVGSGQVDQQVREVLERYQLYSKVQPLRRCPVCNGLLQPVDKELVRHRLKANTARYYHRFQRCPDCDQLYWRGAHFYKIDAWLRNCRSAQTKP